MDQRYRIWRVWHLVVLLDCKIGATQSDSLSGRSPVVLPAEERVPWTVAARAQRYKQHSYFIFSAFVLVAFVVAGIRRIADFWTPIPEERAYYWPGRQASNENPEAEGVDMENPEGGEGAEA